MLEPFSEVSDNTLPHRPILRKDYQLNVCLVLRFVSLSVQYSTVALVGKYLALEMSALWRLVRCI